MPFLLRKVCFFCFRWECEIKLMLDIYLLWCIVCFYFCFSFVFQDECSWVQAWGYAQSHTSLMRFSFIPSFYVHYIYTLGTMCDLSMGVRIDTCSLVHKFVKKKKNSLLFFFVNTCSYYSLEFCWSLNFDLHFVGKLKIMNTWSCN